MKIEGKTALIGVLRTQNMYPISVYAEAIAESVIELYDSEAQNSVELLFGVRRHDAGPQQLPTFGRRR